MGRKKLTTWINFKWRKWKQTKLGAYHVEIRRFGETGVNLDQRFTVDSRRVRVHRQRYIYSRIIALCCDIVVIGGDSQRYGRRHCFAVPCFGFWFNFQTRALKQLKSAARFSFFFFFLSLSLFLSFSLSLSLSLSLFSFKFLFPFLFLPVCVNRSELLYLNDVQKTNKIEYQ